MAAQTGALVRYSTPAGDRYPCAVDYYSITRELIRSGLDLNDALSDCLYKSSLLEKIGLPVLEDSSKPLLDWVAFLRDQGLMIDHPHPRGYPVCMPQLLLQGHTKQDMRRRTNAVFILCLLEADVSIREATTGMQALHFLFLNPWSAELSLHVIDLAYILVHFGGADVHALDYLYESPTTWAFEHGWENEWLIVLDRCGFDPIEVLMKEIELLRKNQSTAIDTEDLSIPKSDFSLRRPVVGDRLDE